ncbi:MAG: NADPH-dependent FMN reductase [Flavobacteriaceae bacterium]|nr:NADPH-dependent FMN reductase [Flavobacteriaceae bacterium]
MKIVAFGASSSKNSINKEFAHYAAKQINNSDINLIDLNDFEMPIFSVDVEKKKGIPEQAFNFKSIIKEADGIIISFAEHNGVYTAAFKNVFDWISRIEKIVWYNRPMFLLSTSDGSRGGITVLEIAHNRISRGNPNIIPKFSLPNFYQNFNHKTGITDQKLKKEFDKLIRIFEKNILE